MRGAVPGVLAILLTLAQAVSFSQSSGQPRAAIDITDAEVKAVLAHQPPSIDRQLRVIDFGSYQLAIGVVHRGPTPAPGTAGGTQSQGGRGAAPNAPPPAPCGQATGESSGVNGITHDATVETYIITSGSGVLLTGGSIMNGRRYAADDQVTRILNGPSCTGTIAGPNLVRRSVKAGDIVVIPENVPHGWTGITDHVTYYSVRPDQKKVLQTGYVHPAIAAMLKSR